MEKPCNIIVVIKLRANCHSTPLSTHRPALSLDKALPSHRHSYGWQNHVRKLRTSLDDIDKSYHGHLRHVVMYLYASSLPLLFTSYGPSCAIAGQAVPFRSKKVMDGRELGKERGEVSGLQNNPWRLRRRFFCPSNYCNPAILAYVFTL